MQSTPQPSLDRTMTIRNRRSVKPATGEDLLGWITEHSELNGKAGLLETWPLEHFSSLFSVDACPDRFESATVTDSLDLSSVLGMAVADARKEEWLAKVMTDHRGLGAKADALVKSQLANLGIPKEDYERASIVANVQRLAEASVPRPANVPFFKVYLMVAKDPWGDVPEKLRLHFPQNVRIPHFMAVLRDLSLPKITRVGHAGDGERQSGGYASDCTAGPWVYRLLSPQMQLNNRLPTTALEHEDDFRELLRTLRKEETPSAVIWHTKTYALFEQKQHKQQQTGQHNVSNGIDAHLREARQEPLDEYGKPYFDDRLDGTDGAQINGDIDWMWLSETGIGGSDVLAFPKVQNGCT